MGRVLASAEGERVKILMTDGEDVAYVLMEPNQALELVIDIMSAAKTAAVEPKKETKK